MWATGIDAKGPQPGTGAGQSRAAGALASALFSQREGRWRVVACRRSGDQTGPHTILVVSVVVALGLTCGGCDTSSREEIAAIETRVRVLERELSDTSSSAEHAAIALQSNLERLEGRTGSLEETLDTMQATVQHLATWLEEIDPRPNASFEAVGFAPGYGMVWDGFTTLYPIFLIDHSTADSAEGVVQWEWSLGDGSTALGQTASHVYENTGTYDVTLTVTDSNGYTDGTTRTIAVLAPPTCAVVVELEEIELVSNDSVGSDWKWTLIIDGERHDLPGTYGQSFTLGEKQAGDSVEITARVVEQDDVCPDSGSYTTLFTVTCHGESVRELTLPVSVQESYCDYKRDNWARWEFHLAIRMTER